MVGSQKQGISTGGFDVNKEIAVDITRYASPQKKLYT